MQQEVEEAFETLKAFQLDWLRWCQQQLVLGSSVYGNVRGESNSTNRRICQVHRLLLGSSIPVLYGSYQEDTVQRNSLFLELKGSKKKQRRVVLQYILWTCPRGKIPAVQQCKDITLVPKMLQSWPRLLRKNWQ